MIARREIQPAGHHAAPALHEPGGSVKTNKAVVVNRGAGVVRKTYFVADGEDRVHQDVRSLTTLRERFGTVTRDGWTYGIVRVLGADPGARWIETEFLAGDTIASLSGAEAVEAELHVGRWLALYQRQLLGGRASGPVFGDANLSNFIFDRAGRRLVAIDPGKTWGRSGHAYEDLAQHFQSCLLGRGLSTLGLRSVLSSRRGYLSERPVHWGSKAYWRAVLHVVAAQARALAGRSRPKLIAFVLVLPVLLPTLLLLAPARQAPNSQS